MRAIAIIPARLASTRLPRKILREIAGRPMLAHVVEAARRCPQLADVIVATDSDEVLAVCKQNGWHAEMTSPAHRSGTDRVWEVAQRVAADVYVNVQGDEPLARPEHISALLTPMRDTSVLVSTVKTPCSAVDVNNPNVVKVVTDLAGRALYFTRATVPFDRDTAGTVHRRGCYVIRIAVHEVGLSEHILRDGARRHCVQSRDGQSDTRRNDNRELDA